MRALRELLQQHAGEAREPGLPPMSVRVIASRDSVLALIFGAALTAAGRAMPWT